MSTVQIHGFELRRATAQDDVMPSVAAPSAPHVQPVRQDEVVRDAEVLVLAAAQAKRQAAEMAARMLTDFHRGLAVTETELAQIVSDAVASIIGEMPEHERTIALVRTALRQIRQARGVVMRLPPSDRHGGAFARVQAMPEFSEIIGRVVTDPGLSPGECVLEVRGARIAIDAAHQLAALGEALDHSTSG